MQKKRCSNNADAFKFVHGMLEKIKSRWYHCLNARENYFEGDSVQYKIYLVPTVFYLISQRTF
jgi:hypothetical protein